MNTIKKTNILKTTFLALALSLGCTVSYGQTGFHKVGIGAELALPIGDFGNAYGIGFGASGKVFYGLSDKANITATLGYLHFGMKEENKMMSGSMGMIPIMFGYRYDFDGLYAEPQLGLTMASSKVKFNDMGIGLSNMSGTHSTTKLSFGLGGGYAFGDYDIAARFQIVDRLNFIGIRLAYNFAL